MLIVYDSRTNSVKNFLKDCGLLSEAVKVTRDLVVDEPFVLVTYTTTMRMDGEKRNGVPPMSTLLFLERCSDYLRGVSASGEKNWGGENFAKSAEFICEKYSHVKLISRFEKRGKQTDRDIFIKGVELLDESLHQVQQ
jgi:protein involved in ribonucleotide reduction